MYRCDLSSSMSSMTCIRLLLLFKLLFKLLLKLLFRLDISLKDDMMSTIYTFELWLV